MKWFSTIAALFAASALAGAASAQQNAAGQALQDAVERSCVIPIGSTSGDRLQLQNVCFNPRAVRISWGNGRIIDYCLSSSGDVRYVAKLSDEFKLVREQDILLCY